MHIWGIPVFVTRVVPLSPHSLQITQSHLHQSYSYYDLLRVVFVPCEEVFYTDASVHVVHRAATFLISAYCQTQTLTK